MVLKSIGKAICAVKEITFTKCVMALVLAPTVVMALPAVQASSPEPAEGVKASQATQKRVSNDTVVAAGKGDATLTEKKPTTRVESSAVTGVSAAIKPSAVDVSGLSVLAVNQNIHAGSASKDANNHSVRTPGVISRRVAEERAWGRLGNGAMGSYADIFNDIHEGPHQQDVSLSVFPNAVATPSIGDDLGHDEIRAVIIEPGDVSLAGSASKDVMSINLNIAFACHESNDRDAQSSHHYSLNALSSTELSGHAQLFWGLHGKLETFYLGNAGLGNIVDDLGIGSVTLITHIDTPGPVNGGLPR